MATLGVNDAKFLREQAKMYRELRDTEVVDEQKTLFDDLAKYYDTIADGIDEALGLLAYVLETTDDSELIDDIVGFIE